MQFSELSRGQQYLRLLEIEYQDLLKYARVNVSLLEQSKEKYLYEETSSVDTEIAAFRHSIRYYEKVLDGLKGAENEESTLIPSDKSEGKSLEQFTGVTCTTVG